MIETNFFCIKKRPLKKAVLKTSTEEEIRTHDPRIHNPML